MFRFAGDDDCMSFDFFYRGTEDAVWKSDQILSERHVLCIYAPSQQVESRAASWYAEGLQNNIDDAHAHKQTHGVFVSCARYTYTQGYH